MSKSNDDVSPAGFGVLGLLAILAFGGLQSYYLDRDLDSVQDRAQISANPQDMLAYLRTMRDNMEKYGATTGHTALLMKTPATDLALHFQALNSVIRRLEQIQTMAADSDAYQSGLDDVRGVLRETPRIAQSVFWVQYGWWLGLLGLLCLGMLQME